MKIVAALQHKKYPWQGIQFHPEKSEFEISLKLQPNLVNNRSIAKIGQTLANGFVEECRTENLSEPSDKEWADAII